MGYFRTLNAGLVNVCPYHVLTFAYSTLRKASSSREHPIFFFFNITKCIIAGMWELVLLLLTHSTVTLWALELYGLKNMYSYTDFLCLYHFVTLSFIATLIMTCIQKVPHDACATHKNNECAF